MGTIKFADVEEAAVEMTGSITQLLSSLLVRPSGSPCAQYKCFNRAEIDFAPAKDLLAVVMG